MSEDERVQRQRWMARGVTVLVALTVDDDYREWREREGTGLEAVVIDGLAALDVLCDSERTGPWSTQVGRDKIRVQVHQMRTLLGSGGITDDVRQAARKIVEAIFPGAEQWLRENPDSAKYGRRR